MNRIRGVLGAAIVGGGMLGGMMGGCAGAPPEAGPKAPEGPATAAPSSAPAAPAGPIPTAAAEPASSGHTMDATSVRPSAAPAAAPAGSRALETAVQTKTTSAGGSYAVGTVAASGIAEADVIQVLNNAAGKTDGCYVPLFKKQLAAVGRTTFEVEIDAAGKTKTVTQKENETKDDKLTRCLDGVIKKLVWPAPLKAPAKATVQWVVKGN